MTIPGAFIDPSLSAAGLLEDLQHDYEPTTPEDVALVATQLVNQTPQGKKGKKAPPKVLHEYDLTASITGIAPMFSNTGGSTLTITFVDPLWNHLLPSHYFDADGDTGELVDFDLMWGKTPDGTKPLWWRLHQLTLQADESIQSVFIPRAVAILQDHKGPLKTARAKNTRAEFLKSLCDKIKDPKITFHCSELHKKQPVAQAGQQALGISALAKAPSSSVGGYTVDSLNHEFPSAVGVGVGIPALPFNVVAALAEWAGMPGVTMAQIAMGESGLHPGEIEPREASGAQGFGLWQITTGVGNDALINAHGGPRAMLNPVTCARVAKIYYDNAGHSVRPWYGTKYMTGTNLHYTGPPLTGGIAGSGGGSPGTGGPSGSGTRTVIQPYYFEVQPGEDYWTAMCRLAKEVGWECICVGDDIFFDPDTELIKTPPALTINRDDQRVLGFSFDWENRHVATNFQLQVACGATAFQPGDVIVVQRFGPASTGSTAKLPGHWLVAEVARNAGDQFSTFTLVQPAKPKAEPAPQVSQVGVGSGAGASSGSAQITGGSGTALAVLQAAKQLDAMNLTYVWGGGHGPGQLDAAHPAGYDCSGSTCWALHKAGMWPSSAAAVSGDLAAGWGQPGRGKYMTVWASAGHVFIEFTVPGEGHTQLNTSNSFGRGRGPRYGPWGGPGAADAASFTPRHWPGQAFMIPVCPLASAVGVPTWRLAAGIAAMLALMLLRTRCWRREPLRDVQHRRRSASSAGLRFTGARAKAPAGGRRAGIARAIARTWQRACLAVGDTWWKTAASRRRAGSGRAHSGSATGRRRGEGERLWPIGMCTRSTADRFPRESISTISAKFGRVSIRHTSRSSLGARTRHAPGNAVVTRPSASASNTERGLG